MAAPKKISENNKMNIDTRVALLEQSIGTINQTLIRIEQRLDRMEHRSEQKLDKLDSKIDAGFTKASTRAWLQFTFLFAMNTGLFAILAKTQGWY